MAKSRLNLQAYQQGILERLQQVTAEPGANRSRLAVYAGSERYLLDLRDISEVLPVPTIQPVPLVQPWFLGMANIRGNLYAITDLARFLGISQQAAVITVESRVLLVHGDFGINAGFLIDNLAGLRSLDEFKLLNMVADVPSHVVGRYEDQQYYQWEVLDIALILEKKEFLQVAA